MDNAKLNSSNLDKSTDKRITRSKKITWNLKCEWADCCLELNNISEFQSHIAIHLHEKEDENCPRKESSSFVCRWRKCQFITSNTSEYYRHGFYHGFHTKLKWVSAIRMADNGLASCKFDDANVNIVPHLPDPLICQWIFNGITCLAEFNDCQSFYEHVSIHGRGVVPRYCHWTGKIFIVMIYNTASLGCPHGNTKFKNLQRHLKHHTQEKERACPNCGTLFASPSKFFEHLHRQLSADQMTELHQCGYCFKSFSLKRHLVKHLSFHLPNFTCPYCEKTAGSKQEILLHITFVHTKIKRFICPICKARSITKFGLADHMRVHGDKKLKCRYDNCDFMSRSSGRMWKHMDRVHVKRTYACHLCEERFDIGYALSKHLSSIHQCPFGPGYKKYNYEPDEQGVYRLRYPNAEIAAKFRLGCLPAIDISCDSELDCL